MAIALDTDLRGLTAPAMAETSLRRSTGKPGGEDFVRSLAELDGAPMEAEATTASEAMALSVPAPLPFALPATDVYSINGDGRLKVPTELLINADQARSEVGPALGATLPQLQELPTPLLVSETKGTDGQADLVNLSTDLRGTPSLEVPAPAIPLAPGVTSSTTPQAYVRAEASIDSPAIPVVHHEPPAASKAPDPAEVAPVLHNGIPLVRLDHSTDTGTVQPTKLTGNAAAAPSSHHTAAEPSRERTAEPVSAHAITSAESVFPAVVAAPAKGMIATATSSVSGAPETLTESHKATGKKPLLPAEPAPESRELASTSSATAVFAALTSVAEAPPDAGTTAETLSPAMPVSLASGATSPSPQPALPTNVPSVFVPAQATVIAAPVELAGIISKAAEDGQSDRVVVQLDPPELGRVSIDFKFDSQGVQHVTITSETPEAMRQLRQMHSELVQALERQGIGSQNMSFQHQQQNPHAQPERGSFHLPSARAQTGQDGGAEILTTTHKLERPRISAGGRLDIKA